MSGERMDSNTDSKSGGVILNNDFLVTIRQLKHPAVVKWKRVGDTFTIVKIGKNNYESRKL